MSDSESEQKDPKFLGKYPIEIESSVIKAPANAYKLEFYAKEYLGMGVFHDLPDPIRVTDLRPIKERDAIKPGDKIIVPGMFDDFFRVTVGQPDSVSELTFSSPHVFGSLHFGQDDRKCWVMMCLGDARALARVEFE